MLQLAGVTLLEGKDWFNRFFLIDLAFGSHDITIKLP